MVTANFKASRSKNLTQEMMKDQQKSLFIGSYNICRNFPLKLAVAFSSLRVCGKEYLAYQVLPR